MMDAARPGRGEVPMGNTRAPVQGGKELRSRIELYLLEEGLQCSQCVIAMLSDRIGPKARVLEEAVLPLGKGISGTGSMCGAVAGALMALALVHQQGSGSQPRQPAALGYLSSVPPINDWLDVAPAVAVEPPLFPLCRKLIARVHEAVQRHGGDLSCSSISGVDWREPTSEQLARYYRRGGEVATCVEIIARSVETVAELADS